MSQIKLNCAAFHEKFVQPVKAVVTRWCSEYNMVVSMLQTGKSINQCIADMSGKAVLDVDEEGFLTVQDRITDQEFDEMRMMKSILAPYDYITSKSQADSHPTLHELMPDYIALERLHAGNNNDGKEAKASEAEDKVRGKPAAIPYSKKKDLSLQLATQLDKKFLTSHLNPDACPEIFLAPFFDPKRRDLNWLPRDLHPAFWNLLRRVIEEELKKATPAAAASSVAAAQADAAAASESKKRKRQEHEDDDEDLRAYKQRVLAGLDSSGGRRAAAVVKDPVQSLIDGYKTAVYNVTKTTILEFWALHRLTFPVLYSLAMRYLCIPATSATSERVFSAAGRVFTPLRGSLKPSNLEDLTMIKINFDIAEQVLNHCIEHHDVAVKAVEVKFAAPAAAAPAALAAPAAAVNGASADGGAGSPGLGLGGGRVPGAAPGDDNLRREILAQIAEEEEEEERAAGAARALLGGLGDA